MDCNEQCERLFDAYRGLFQCACGHVYVSNAPRDYEWYGLQLDDARSSDGEVNAVSTAAGV